MYHVLWLVPTVILPVFVIQIKNPFCNIENSELIFHASNFSVSPEVMEWATSKTLIPDIPAPVFKHTIHQV